MELAIAFFLLGGDTTSAVTVCAKNLGDEQLALVICRLVEGYGGTLELNLISKFLLPSSLAKGDYWLASVLEVFSKKSSLVFDKVMLLILRDCVCRSSSLVCIFILSSFICSGCWGSIHRLILECFLTQWGL